MARRTAGEAQESGGDAPGNDLEARGAQAQRLGLVLVVADGIEHQAEARGIEPAQNGEGGDAESGAEEIEQQALARETAGIYRHLHARGAAEPGPARRAFAGGNAQ